MRTIIAGLLLIGSTSSFAIGEFNVLGRVAFEQNCAEENLMFHRTEVRVNDFKERFKDTGHAFLMADLGLNYFIKKDTSTIEFLDMPDGTVGVQQHRCK